MVGASFLLVIGGFVAIGVGYVYSRAGDEDPELLASPLFKGISQWADLDFSPDGRQIALLHHSYDARLFWNDPEFPERPVVLYDARTLEPAAEQLGGVPEVSVAQDAVYSADGRFLAVSFALFHEPTSTDPFGSPIFVWDLYSPAAPVRRVDTGALFNSMVLSPDGRRLFAALWPPGDVHAFDTATGELLGSAAGVGGRIAISPDGSQIAATGLLNGRISVIDAASLVVRRELTGPPSTPFGPPVFSHDGARVAAADGDAEIVYVWDVAAGDIVEELVGPTAYPDGIWFDADDTTVHASAEDDTLLVWDLRATATASSPGSARRRGSPQRSRPSPSRATGWPTWLASTAHLNPAVRSSFATSRQARRGG